MMEIGLITVYVKARTSSRGQPERLVCFTAVRTALLLKAHK